MNKYNKILSTVACKYNILRGITESENDWKTRLVYSICNMMAYASLWDSSDDESISIIHLKGKVSRILTCYRSMYPELSDNFPEDSKQQLEDEIKDLFLKAGVVYHCPHRILPSMKREEPFDNILFQRGIALDNISCISGAGFYSKHETILNQKPDKVKAMFGLELNNLYALWHETLSNASWKEDVLTSMEFLRLKSPFNHGYWGDRPDTTGSTSILRTGMKGSWLYYLYRYLDTKLEVCPLQPWQVESGNHRLLACACLANHGTLPPITYWEDGAIVRLHMKYLLPPQELVFLKLYSWPEGRVSFPCDFNRKISTEIFTVVIKILSGEGYEFKEGAI